MNKRFEKRKLKSIRTHDVIASSELIETRAANLDNRVVEGYAATWDGRNSHGEEFHRGAFAKSINDRGADSTSKYKIKFRHEHWDTIGLLAELREDETGLYFRTHPLDEGDLEDEVLKKLKSGVYNNFSIGFRYVQGKASYDAETDTIHVFEANLLEISVVGIPSDERTFAIRSNEGEIERLSDDTEKFILSLPRNMELQARHLFATYQSLVFDEQPSQEGEALKTTAEQTDGSLESRALDLDYIRDNFKL